MNRFHFFKASAEFLSNRKWILPIEPPCWTWILDKPANNWSGETLWKAKLKSEKPPQTNTKVLFQTETSNSLTFYCHTFNIKPLDIGIAFWSLPYSSSVILIQNLWQILLCKSSFVHCNSVFSSFLKSFRTYSNWFDNMENTHCCENLKTN